MASYFSMILNIKWYFGDFRSQTKVLTLFYDTPVWKKRVSGCKHSGRKKKSGYNTLAQKYVFRLYKTFIKVSWLVMIVFVKLHGNQSDSYLSLLVEEGNRDLTTRSSCPTSTDQDKSRGTDSKEEMCTFRISDVHSKPGLDGDVRGPKEWRGRRETIFLRRRLELSSKDPTIHLWKTPMPIYVKGFVESFPNLDTRGRPTYRHRDVYTSWSWERLEER